MAVGHERQRELKKAKSGTKAGSVPGQNKAEADALRISISAKSSDSELDSVKVSEMLDSTTGGLAEVQQCVKSAVQASTSPAKTKDSEEGKVAEAETQTDTMTKSARKRAVKNKKKQLIGDPATKQESTQSAPPAPDTLDWSEQPMNDNSNRTLLSQTQNAGITTNEKVRTVESKFSKEEKAEYRAKKAEAARLLKQSIEKPESTETATHAAQLDESSQVTVNPDLSTKRKKDKAQQKNKKSLLSISNECSPALNPSNTAELKVDVPNNHTNSLQTDSEVSEPPTTETIMKPISTSNRPIANNKHRSQKSMDVRLRLNGQNHKTLSVDSPRHATTSPSKIQEKSPLKIKLPGKDVTFVYSEEFSRSHSKSSRGRSHATSVSSQYSGPSTRSGHDIRSRQSSHTTVGTTGALEHKLHSMILSNSETPAANQSTTSLSSEPATRSSRGLSPPDIHSASHSAPPLELTMSTNEAHPVQMSTSDESRISTELPGSLKPAVPAIPTVFEARPSQLHAPPSLGPPQLQNLPDQMPQPYHGGNMGRPNHSTSHYNAQYQMQNPYYNYYPMAQPMYNSYPMPSPGLNQPFYEQPMPINGMIYYNPDGSQAYPQEYYQYPPVFMNPYQQQHYDY